MSFSLPNVCLENSYFLKETHRQGLEKRKKNLSQRQLLTKQVFVDAWKETRKLQKPSDFLSSLLDLQGFLISPLDWAEVLQQLPPCKSSWCNSNWALCSTAWRITTLNSSSKGQLKLNHTLEKVQIPSTQRKAAHIWSEKVPVQYKAIQQLLKKMSVLFMSEKSPALVFIIFLSTY